jgi:transposase
MAVEIFSEMGKSGDLTIQEKWGIVCRYFWYTDPSTGKLQNGALKSILSKVNRGKSTVMRTMKEFREMCNQQETLTPDLNETFGQRTGRPSELTEELKAEIKDVNERTGGRLTILELSNRIQVSVSTMRRYLISMEAERKSTWVKPKLSYQQQMERLRFVLNLRHGNRARFKSLQNVIMVDESWFYLHKVKGYVRIFPGDDMPDPISVQHKSHIPKVMFLAAVAQPSPEHDFDGKISLIRVCEEMVAKRKSTYHEAGDVYIHDCTMNAERYRSFMMQVFRDVKMKMPWLKGKEVIIQQDGASPHVGRGNIEYFNQEGRKDGWKIQVVTQPPQSPDLNVNDLGFFRSLKCRVETLKDGANNMDELYDSVLEAWDRYDGPTLTRIWAHQFECYREIIRCVGDNTYLGPHSGVRKRVLAIDLNLDTEEYEQAKEWLDDYDGL